MGVNGTCGNGSDNKIYSLNLATTTSGAMVYGAAAMRNRTHTPGAGYTERTEILQGSSESSSSASLAIQEMHVAAAGTVTLNGAFSNSADWAVAGLELRPLLTMSKRSDSAAKENAPPAEFTLEVNYPNPFSASGIFNNPSTAINFSLPVAANVRLNIYNVVGQLVRVLVAGEMAAGRYSEPWNGRDNFNRVVAAGVYLYQIVVESGDGKVLFTQTRRMTLLK